MVNGADSSTVANACLTGRSALSSTTSGAAACTTVLPAITELALISMGAVPTGAADDPWIISVPLAAPAGITSGSTMVPSGNPSAVISTGASKPDRVTSQRTLVEPFR